MERPTPKAVKEHLYKVRNNSRSRENGAATSAEAHSSAGGATSTDTTPQVPRTKNPRKCVGQKVATNDDSDESEVAKPPKSRKRQHIVTKLEPIKEDSKDTMVKNEESDDDVEGLYGLYNVNVTPTPKRRTKRVKKSTTPAMTPEEAPLEDCINVVVPKSEAKTRRSYPQYY